MELAGPKKFYNKFLSVVLACFNPGVLQLSPQNNRPFRYAEHIIYPVVTLRQFHNLASSHPLGLRLIFDSCQKIVLK